MLIFLTTLLASLASIFRSRASLGLENLALRHQIGVLQRSAGKRPKLTSGDRLLWICLSRLWRDWRSALAIVKPETVVAWHRAAFRLFWTWKGALRKTRTTRHFKRSPRSDSQDVPGESRLGCTPHPRRTAQTGHRHRAEQCQQIYSANIWCAAANRRLRLGAPSWRTMPSSWSRSTSSPCPLSVSRSFTYFWFWPMTGVASCTQCDRPPDRRLDRTATARGISLCPTPALPPARPRCNLWR